MSEGPTSTNPTNNDTDNHESKSSANTVDPSKTTEPTPIVQPTEPAVTAAELRSEAQTLAEEEPAVKDKGKGKEVPAEDEKTEKHASIDMSQIELTASDLYNKAKVDIGSVELEDVWSLLRCNEQGLSNEEHLRRKEIFGPNEIVQKEPSAILQFLLLMWNPLSWVMEGAALVAIALSNGEGAPPDWQDFVGIILLLLINSSIAFYEQRSGESAIKSLMESVAPKARCLRDGSWIDIEAADLVPGDVITFKFGDIVPADCRLFAASDVLIDQAGLTGESLPQSKSIGDQCYSASIGQKGEGKAVVIGTGGNTFFGRAAALVGDTESTGHLQKVLGDIGLFCLASIGIFVLLEILILYADYRQSYRRGLNNILVLLIGGIPIAMPTVLSVTLAVGAQQLAKYKAIVLRINAIEELAGVTILCSDKTGTLTTNKLTIDRETIKPYGDHTADQIMLFAAYASDTENPEPIDRCIVGALKDPADARKGIKIVHLKPFNPVAKRSEITYVEDEGGAMKRISKGAPTFILDLCTRNKTPEIVEQLHKDTGDLALRGFRTLAVAIEDVPSGDKDAEGSGFELVGLLSIFDPPRADTQKTLDDAQALGVKVKMVTGDQLAIAKETGRRLGLGDNMFSAHVLKPDYVLDAKYATLGDMLLDANGFADVFPEDKHGIVKSLQGLGHLVAMTGDGANDVPALARANVGIAVEGATPAARSAASIVLTEPGLSTIVHAIRQSRIVFQRMRNYAIYACAVTIRIVLGFGIMAFAFQFDFPPFMVLIIALLNDGTIMTLSVDRVLPSSTPDSWDLAELFAYAIAYGTYLALGTIAFYLVIVETTFFSDKFGVVNITEANDYGLHMIIYLQVAQISQALIFVTRSHSWFFVERPSVYLVIAFAIAQLVSSIIAAFGNWNFTNVAAVSGGYIGIVWVWNLIWFFPLDLIKFGMRSLIKRYNAWRLSRFPPTGGAPLQRSQSRLAKAHESMYANTVNFIKRPLHRATLGEKRIAINETELQRFTSRQAVDAGNVLSGSVPPTPR